MTVQNIEISLWQEQAERSGYVDERQKYSVSSEIIVIYGCMVVNSAENPCITPGLYGTISIKWLGSGAEQSNLGNSGQMGVVGTEPAEPAL